MGIGRGYGKLLLFGEHAAVYGYPALGLQLPGYLEVEVRPHGGDYWELPPLDDRASRLIATAIEALPGIVGHEIAPHTLLISGNLPMSVGLGSSAAFCTALLRAVSPDGLARAPAIELWQAAHRLEHVFHGTPSGIDTGLSLMAGSTLIFPNPPGLPSANPVTLPQGWLVVGAVPRSGSTAELVSGIRKRRTEDPVGTEALLKTLGSISQSAGQLEGAQAVDELGKLAGRAQAILQELSLSTPVVDHALGILDRAGASGGKISGAGGGGAFFGVFRDRQQAHLAASGLTEWLASSSPLPTGPYTLVVPLQPAEAARSA